MSHTGYYLSTREREERRARFHTAIARLVISFMVTFTALLILVPLFIR